MVLAEGVFFLGSVDDGSICGLNDALEVQWEWTEDAGSYVVADGATLCRTSATGIELVDIPTLQRRVVALSVPVALGTVFRAGNVIAKYSMGRGDSWAVDTVSRQTVWQKTSLQFGFVARWRDAVIWCDEALSAADIGSGALLWETPLNSRVIKGVKVVGDRCYFGDEEGNITVLDCATGTPLFQKELPSGSRALDICLVVPMGDDALLVGTRDRILCLQMD
ncbi:MAG: PQQ-binding-like beta-propeller repeat protein [Vicinamibacteria bacterium]